MDDLAKIIELRSDKLERIEGVEKQKKQSVRNARADLRAAQGEIQSFSDQMRGMEHALLSKLVGKHVTVNDMTMVEQILEKAKNHAKKLIESANEAEKYVEECIEDLESTRAQRILVKKKLNNISEVNKEYVKKKLKLARISAEAEEEEIMETVFNISR